MTSSDKLLLEIFSKSESIAVVGLSDKTDRPSYQVASYLLDCGYKIFPVNPNISQTLGLKSYPDLFSLPMQVDVVDIFRKSFEVLPIVKAAVKIGAKVIWMQEGVENEEAKKFGEENGLIVISNRCMMKERKRFFGEV